MLHQIDHKDGRPLYQADGRWTGLHGIMEVLKNMLYIKHMGNDLPNFNLIYTMKYIMSFNTLPFYGCGCKRSFNFKI